MRIGAVQHGIVLIAVALSRFQRGNLVGDHIGLLIVAETLNHGDAFAQLILAEQVFFDLTFVLFNQAVGGIGNHLRRAVVALQLEGLEVFVEALQPQDIVDVRATETVDALRIITHDAQPVVFLAQLIHDQVLREVGVLVLVNKDILEKVLIPLQHIGVVAQQDVGVIQQIVKVHRSGDVASFAVGLVDVRRLGAHGIAVGIDEILIAFIVVGTDERILGIADLRLDGRGLVEFVIKTHILDDEFDQGPRVALVIDGEVGFEAQ